MGDWNKYWIFSLQRDELTRIMMSDARNETKWVKDQTYEACMTCPKLSEKQLDDQAALEEDL